MKAAIYARKSKLTEKGDSIENQIKLCKDYLGHMNIEEIYIYKDEGFSGKNTDRPEFLKMLQDAKNEKFNILVCYKLDRISRNVADFSALAKDLEALGISFISVNEQFDTSSAMGRAMMYIASVFSQLERETISSRVRDNMYALAETGKWLGGTPPTGYRTERFKFKDMNSNEKSFCILVPIPEEVALIELIYDKYLELKSINKVEKYLLCNNIKTKNNKNWSTASISTVLTATVYVKADIKVVEYLKALGLKVNGKPDNNHGILTYKKRKGKSGANRIKNTQSWIASISFHEGIISSSKWLQVQQLINTNKSKAPALGSSGDALLSGIVRCSCCNSPLRVSYGKNYAKTGRKKHYYVCTLKHKLGKASCDNKNINGTDLDEIILKMLKELPLNKTILIQELKKFKDELEKSNENIFLKKLKTSLDQNNQRIDNLLNSLSLNQDTETAKILLNKVTELKLKKKSIENKIAQIQKENNTEKNSLASSPSKDTFKLLSNLSHGLSLLTTLEKKKLLSSVVDKIYVNGTSGEIHVKLKGVEPE